VSDRRRRRSIAPRSPLMMPVVLGLPAPLINVVVSDDRVGALGPVDQHDGSKTLAEVGTNQWSSPSVSTLRSAVQRLARGAIKSLRVARTGPIRYHKI